MQNKTVVISKPPKCIAIADQGGQKNHNGKSTVVAFCNVSYYCMHIQDW